MECEQRCDGPAKLVKEDAGQAPTPSAEWHISAQPAYTSSSTGRDIV